MRRMSYIFKQNKDQLQDIYIIMLLKVQNSIIFSEVFSLRSGTSRY